MKTDARTLGVSHIGAADAELQPGQKVGEYEIESKIGAGGFGTVFKAVHPLIGKIAAIKVLSRQYSAQPEMVSRFVAEARAVNQIRHRHIIDIFAFGQLDDGRHYYVMEYLDGMPLEDYIEERGRLNPAEAIPILRSVAKALDAAHAKGIAHRDLKPDNVLLEIGDGGAVIEPKLLDFGIAKLLGDEVKGHKTKTGAPMGTPHYMSPEQCRGRDVDHRTDIYAFGIMTYKMLTGRVPFDGEDYMEILFAQISEEAAPPSSIVPELSAAVDQAVAWMMKKEPAERPPNLVTAVRSLEEAVQSAGHALPVPPAPSGVYAAHTSPLTAQSTPANVARLPSESDLGLAPTVAPDTLAPLSEEAASAAPTGLPLGAKIGLILGAVAVAVVLGIVVNGQLAKKSEDRGGSAAASGVQDTAGSPAEPAADSKPEDNGAAAAGATADPARAADTEDKPVVPPPPRYVTISIDGPPAGTEVYGPHGLIGVAPGKVQLDHGEEPVILTFRADKHLSQTREVVPSEDRTLEITLKPEKRRSSRARRADKKTSGKKTKTPGKKTTPEKKDDRKNSIDNPFDK